jgi:hypothetical protein
VKVVLCLLLAGVGQEEVVGVCPEWMEPTELSEPPPPRLTPGSGLSFLKAPSKPATYTFMLKYSINARGV